MKARVLAEKQDLDAKLDFYLALIASPDFSEFSSREQLRICQQVSAMTRYSAILAERIAESDYSKRVVYTAEDKRTH